MSLKITYIISNIDKAVAFEWIEEAIDKNKFKLSFILLNPGNSYLEEYLIKRNIKVDRIAYKSKRNIPSAIFKIIALFIKNRPDVVHAHLFDAAFVALIASKLCGIKKRIYTRHYSTYHHQYFPAAVKWDKLNNRLATHIIAISKIVEDVLIEKEYVKPKKITIIYHGFKLDDFSEMNAERIQLLNHKYNLSNKHPVVGVISRFTELKGVQYIIPAFKDILKDNSNALLLLFNASGDYEMEINKQLEDLPADSYKKIPFENDIMSLYHIFDVFIHVPINKTIEAFGQTYIESMASGTPLIATPSGIGNEILLDRDNALVVSYKNSQEIYIAATLLINDKFLRKRLLLNAKETVKKEFQLSVMIKKLEALYLR